jgi:GNAT superfamily N-acetyltransferase
MIKLKHLILESEIKKFYGYFDVAPSNLFGGIPKVESFVVYPKYRGKGFAKKLARFLPKHCWLHAQPLANMPGKKLEKKDLIEFYKSIGFTEIFLLIHG